jgi:hypothetical protein
MRIAPTIGWDVPKLIPTFVLDPLKTATSEDVGAAAGDQFPAVAHVLLVFPV